MNDPQMDMLKAMRAYTAENSPEHIESGVFFDDDGSFVVEWYSQDFEKDLSARVTPDGRIFEIRPRGGERELKMYRSRTSFMNRVIALNR